MADPKIKYDVEARATGQAEVLALAKSLDSLDDAVSPEVAQRANELSQAVRRLGEERSALLSFQQLGQASRDATRDVAQLEAQFDDLRREIEASGETTAKQRQGLQSLSDGLQRARDRATTAGEALRDARARLAEFGQGGTTLARTGEALKTIDGQAEQLKNEIKGLSTEVEKLRDGQQAAKALETSFRTLGIQGVQSVEREVTKLQQALAAIRANPSVLPADKTRAVEAFNQRLAELRTQAGGAQTGLNQVAQAGSTAGTSLAAAAQRAVAWTAALAGIAGGAQVVRNVIETGAAFETLRGRLESLLGSADAGEKAFDRIKNLAATTPFEVTALTESFAKLTAFGLQPTDDQMRAIADTAATLGGGTEVLTGVTLALGQAWAKGKLQGEEILQLAERGVPVWEALARATGRNEQELQRMSSAGELGRDVIRQLIDELGRQNFGASAKLMDTFNGAVSNTKDAMAEFFDLIGRSGVLEYLTGQLQDALAEFERMKDTGELELRARAVADTFIALAEAAGTVVDVISTLSGAIRVLIELMIAQRVLAFVNGLRLVGPAGLEAANGVRAAATAMQTASAASGGLAVASGAVTGALGRVGLAVASLAKVAGPLILVDALGRLAFEFFRAKAAAEEADRAAARMMAETFPLNGPAMAAREVAVGFRSASKAATEANAEIERIASSGEAAEKKLQDIARASGDLLTYTEGIRAFGSALSSAFYGGKLAADDAAKAWAQAIEKLNAEDLRKFETAATQAFEAGRFGAQTLADVLNISARQAVKNAGLDFEQLATGVGRATREILSQVDGLVGAYDRLKVQGVDAGAAIFEKITQAIKEAKTEEELEAIEKRIVAIGRAAPAAGREVTDALDAIGKRSKELTEELKRNAEGVKALEEAYKTLGLANAQSARDTANKMMAAYRLVAADATASAETKRLAFQKAANAIIAANGGVIDSETKVRAEIMGLVVDVDETGKAIVRTQAEAAKAAQDMIQRFDRVRGSVRGIAEEAEDAAGSFGMMSAAAADLAGGPAAAGALSGSGYAAELKAAAERAAKIGSNGFSDFKSEDYRKGTVREAGGFQVDVPEGYYYTLDPYDRNVERSAGYTRSGQPIPGFFARNPGYRPGNANDPDIGPFGGTAGARGSSTMQPGAVPPASPMPAAAPTQQVERVVQLDLTVSGRGPFSVVTSPSLAEQLLREIELARLGGG